MTRSFLINKMCESTNPEEHLNQNNDFNMDNTSDDDDNHEEEDSEIEDELTSEELLEIDSKLDALNLALDGMESKRETIHTQLLELLKSNQDVRKELREEKQMSTDDQAETT